MTTTPTEADIATAIVTAYCGWHIAPSRDDDYVLDGTLAQSVQLPTLHMTELLQLAVDGKPIDVADDAIVQWSQSGFIRRIDGDTFGAKLRTIDVSITHGYDSMPLEVQSVIDRVAARADVGSSYTRVGNVMHALGKDGVPVGMQLTDVEQAALAKYVLPPRP